MTEHFPPGPDELADDTVDPRTGADLDETSEGGVEEGNVDATDDDGDVIAPFTI